MRLRLSRLLRGGGAEHSAERLFSRDTLYLAPIFLPVTLAGFGAVGLAVWRLGHTSVSLGYVAGVAALLIAAVFAEAFPVPVDNSPTGRVSLAATFILGAAMIYGWPAAVVVGLLTRATLEIAERRPPVRLLYNAALYALSGAAAGAATAPFSRHEHVALLLAEVVAGAAAFYFVNIP